MSGIYLTIVFRFALSTFIANEQFIIVWIVALLYGTIVFIIGWIFGRQDSEDLALYDLRFRYHLITYVLCNLIAELWFLFGFHSPNENVQPVHQTALLWGIGIVLH